METKNCGCAIPTDPAILEKVAAIAAPYKGREDMLIQVLKDAQVVANNGIAADVAAVIAAEMGLPISKVYGVVTFYSMFSTQARGKYIIRMCKSAPCHVKGAKEVLKAMEEALGISVGETTPDGKFTLETCECLGICNVAPAIMVNDDVHEKLTPETVKEVLAKY